MRIQEPLFPAPSRITVVDDVVTKGATLLAAVSLVKMAYPEIEVAGFALVRTRGFQEVTQLVEPCVGIIKLDAWGGTDRSP